MSLNPRCLALNQISGLVQSVNKKNYKSTCTELSAVSWRAQRGGRPPLSLPHSQPPLPSLPP